MAYPDWTGINNILRHTTKPIYVLRMNWPRLSIDSKIKWLRALVDACHLTIDEASYEIQRLSEERLQRELDEHYTPGSSY